MSEIRPVKVPWKHSLSNKDACKLFFFFGMLKHIKKSVLFPLTKPYSSEKGLSISGFMSVLLYELSVLNNIERKNIRLLQYPTWKLPLSISRICCQHVRKSEEPYLVPRVKQFMKPAWGLDDMHVHGSQIYECLIINVLLRTVCAFPIISPSVKFGTFKMRITQPLIVKKASFFSYQGWAYNSD